MAFSPQALLKIARQVAEKQKGADIEVLEIGKLSIIADYFLICSGKSTIHVKGIAREIIAEIEKATGLIPRAEGLREGRWVLLDYGGLVVHVFIDEERKFYNLERLWRDAPRSGCAQI
ncbi:MAG: ribosome silencing factor [Desulfotomaculales bacterium]